MDKLLFKKWIALIAVEGDQYMAVVVVVAVAEEREEVALLSYSRAPWRP